jgi:glyoxylate/hydroxypyruvate reductase A
MTKILFYLDGYGHDHWRSAFETIAPDIEFLSYPDWGTADDGPAYAFVWEPKVGLLAQYPNIKAIFSVGAGVDHLTRDPDLPKNIPIIRMSDEGLREGMNEFVLMSVLMHHRNMPKLAAAQRQKRWLRLFPPAAKNVQVGIMGYGALGKSCAQLLKPLGYQIASWSGSNKPNEAGVTHYVGKEEFEPFMQRTDILVGLLPSTPETRGLLNEKTMALLPKRAAIINAGRGSLIDLEALIKLLDDGHLSAATLDVVPSEPLAEDHPLWTHEKVIITPHIAAVTRPETAAEYVCQNIKKIEAGETPDNILNLTKGY